MNIEGIKIFEHEFITSQYAGDAFIYIQPNEKSSCGSMKLLDRFKLLYGLRINRKKKL